MNTQLFRQASIDQLHEPVHSSLRLTASPLISRLTRLVMPDAPSIAEYVRAGRPRCPRSVGPDAYATTPVAPSQPSGERA